MGIDSEGDEVLLRVGAVPKLGLREGDLVMVKEGVGVGGRVGLEVGLTEEGRAVGLSEGSSVGTWIGVWVGFGSGE